MLHLCIIWIESKINTKDSPQENYDLLHYCVRKYHCIMYNIVWRTNRDNYKNGKMYGKAYTDYQELQMFPGVYTNSVLYLILILIRHGH